MRIIPKKARISMGLFKGIEPLDIMTAAAGITLTLFTLLSSLPLRWMTALIVFIVFSASIIPLDDEKTYKSLYYAIRYTVSYKEFVKYPEKKRQIPVAGMIPFTGISDMFIEYRTSYLKVVVETPSIEFRFLTEPRQDQLIDQVYSSILRTVNGIDSVTMIKLDRPVLYDSFIEDEKKKMEDLKAAYICGLMTDGELTVRIGTVQDRMSQLELFSNKETVYLSFRYVVFFGRDRGCLTEQAQNMADALGPHGIECRILKEQGLAIFLKYSCSGAFDEREAWKLAPDQYMDQTLPDRLAVTSRTAAYNGLVTHNLRVTDYPIVVPNAWGHALFSRPDMRVTLKMGPIDKYKEVKQIDRAVDELREQGASTRKTGRLMELGGHVDAPAEALSLLQGDNEILMDVNVFIAAYNYEASPKLLGPGYRPPGRGIGMKRQIHRELSEWEFKPLDMFMRQFDTYASGHISVLNASSRDRRGIHSGPVTTAFPCMYKVMMEEKRICLGKSAGRPIFLDFFARNKERVNSNMMVVGKSGSSKSYAIESILANLATENSKIFILDPGSEYLGLAYPLKGKVINVGSTTRGRLNLFHIITRLSDEGDELDGDEEGNQTPGARVNFNMHVQFLRESYRQMLPGIGADALEHLNNITIRMYGAKGIDAETNLSGLTPGDYPTFDDLCEKVLNDFQISTGDYSKRNLAVLLNYISKFATRGRNARLWNGEASMSIQENFIMFNFQSLLTNKNNTVANVQMLLVLKWLDDEIIENRDYNSRYGTSKKIIIVTDEAHVFIDSKYPVALDFMYQMAKRIRKYNRMQIIATQNIKDFVGAEELTKKPAAVINACQHSFIFPLSPNDMHGLCRLYEKAGAINGSGQDKIVDNGRGQAFVVTSPSERNSINVETPKDIERLFGI